MDFCYNFCSIFARRNKLFCKCSRFFEKTWQKAAKAAERATEKAVEKKSKKKLKKQLKALSTTSVIQKITNFESPAAKSEPTKPNIPPVTNKEVSTSSKTVAATAKNKRYPFERGTIYQQTSAMGMEANPVIYFDNYGDLTATETKSEMKVFGMIAKVHTKEIVKGDEHWNLDLEEKKRNAL